MTFVKRFSLVAVSLSLLLSSGCRKPAAPSRAAEPAPRDLLQDTSGELVDEAWDVYLMQGAKVGQRRTRVFRESSPAGELLRVESLDKLELRRFGDVIRQEFTSVSLESPNGQVRQLAYRVVNGDSVRAASGIITRGQMELQHSDDQQTTRYVWPEDQGGIFAIEQTLRRQPLKPGEQRRVTAFLPLLDRRVQQMLTAKAPEATTILDRQETLLRIEAVDELSETWKIPTIYWCREDGTIMKTQDAFLNRETLRVDEAQANRPNDIVRVDLGVDIGVPIAKPITHSTDVTRAVYKVHLEGLAPQAVFASGLSQRIVAGDDNTALVTVSRVTPNSPAQVDVKVSEPTGEDLASNAIIQSAHPRVVALAKAVADTITDPWQAALLMENFLYRSLGKQDFSQVFSSAGEVAEKKQGDCSEHAVLLAAACRARGIPARVAIGLLYTEADQSFLYHMWTEVWIKDRWIPLDATLGRGGVGGCHLKLRDSNLAHQSPYSLVSPVIYLIGKLRIEPVSVDRELLP